MVSFLHGGDVRIKPGHRTGKNFPCGISKRANANIPPNMPSNRRASLPHHTAAKPPLRPEIQAPTGSADTLSLSARKSCSPCGLPALPSRRSRRKNQKRGAKKRSRDGKDAAAFWLLWNQNSSFSSMYLRSSLRWMRICSIVSRSRTVTVPSSTVSKSTVMQSGVPISSSRR